jgi:3-phenylpropionate/trans-cinnamate dioxygenase ferredoxin component
MAEGFIKVAQLDELEEDTLYPIDVDGEPICLTKVAGTVYAFTDNCTHISGPLNQGEFVDCVVTCPWHGARFDVRSGTVLRGPARQNLYIYTVKIEDDAVFIDLPPEE